MRIVMAQINHLVGDLAGNAGQILRAAEEARDVTRADLVVFSELALTGYPPEDLLLRPGFLRRANETLREIADKLSGIEAVVGFPEQADGHLYNACAWLKDGDIADTYRKHALPNYAVFDEKRYFRSADDVLVRGCAGRRVGVVICEDLWDGHAVSRAAGAGAEVILAPNASPYALGKQAERERVVGRHVTRHGVAIVYCNALGGQDELVFDGRSFVTGVDGEITGPVPMCREGLYAVDFDDRSCASPAGWSAGSVLSEEAEVWEALKLGLRDYVDKTGFPGALIGLSGGIDSALTAVLAADALGPGRVTCVMMPSRYTASMSLEDARALSENLGVQHETISIEPPFEAFLEVLKPYFHGREPDLAEQNLQARSRGNILMALSNKLGGLVLATSNKSELAVGYATIYGDMCGGYAPIKDVYKTVAYRLARWRNTVGAVIPERIIERPPSAELAADQQDQDTLPPYEELDSILERYVERDESIHEIAESGHDIDTVRHVAAMVLKTEYKRRQAAPGPRITRRAFGRDRRYPITSGWREGSE
jgi:NAD+ synthase (glutamine-hydrolysing)